MRRDSVSDVSEGFMADTFAEVSDTGSASGRSARRREHDLLGARRDEIDRVWCSLLTPHLVGDFANDLAVLHLKEMGQAHGEFGADGIGNIWHLVANDSDVADLVVEHELLGREPAQRHHATIGDGAEDPAIGLENLGLVIHYDPARGRLPADRVAIKRDCFLDSLWCLIMKMRLDYLQIARDDLIARQRAVRSGGIHCNRPFDGTFNASHSILPGSLTCDVCCRRSCW